MCSTDKCMNCFCSSKTATIFIAIWNTVTWIILAIGLFYVGATSSDDSFVKNPLHGLGQAAKFLVFIAGVAALLVGIVNIIMLWGAAKKRPSYLRLWIIVTAVAEVPVCVIRHMITPTSWVLGETFSRTIIEIIFMRVVYVYEQTLRRANHRPEEYNETHSV